MYGQVSNYFYNNSNYSGVYQGFSTDGTYNVTYPMTWGQVSGTLIEGALWGFGNWQYGDFPLFWGNLTGWLSYPPLAIYERFHELTARRTNSLSTVGVQVKPGTLSWVYKKPEVVGWSGGKFQGQWEWTFLYVTAKAKWMWWSPVTNAVPNTLVGVFAIGGFQTPSPMAPVHPVGITEIYSGSSNSWNTWTYPEEWQIDTTSPWSELAGLANTNYTKLDVSTDGNWLYMEFGGPGEVTGALADMPPHPAEPIDSGNDGYWGSATFWDNAGSLGTAKGILVNEAYIVRDWDFQYCKTKYW
jgi:hypothetical protein